MEKTRLKIAIVGEFHYANPLHKAINEAIDLSSASLNVSLDYYWMKFNELDAPTMARMNAWWIHPSAMHDFSACWTFFEHVIPTKTPLLLTGTGFQLLTEFCIAQTNVPNHLFTREMMQESELKNVSVIPFSHDLIRLFEQQKRTELSNNSYLIPLNLQTLLEQGWMDIEATDERGNVEIYSLKNHPFCVALKHHPQVWSSMGERHPLIDAFIRASSLKSF